MIYPMMTRKAQAQMEEKFSLERRAIELLQIVASEFASDITSVQCFDLRIVEEIKLVAKKLTTTLEIREK